MKNKATICVQSPGPRGGAITPIDPSTANKYIGKDDVVYPRYFNTRNQQVIVQKLCALESGEDGLVFSSGMAAISSTLFALLGHGDHIILAKEIYGGTHKLAVEEFEKFGIAYDFVPVNDPTSLAAAIRKETKVIYFETPSNPLQSIADIRQIAGRASEHKLVTVADNTFATPICQNPLALGVDVVVHSGTKYLGGHSDLSFGAVVTSAKLKQLIHKHCTNYGGSLNSLDCYVVERSLKTLALRVERQCDNALLIAQHLQQHPGVKKVYYPGLSGHPGHEVAREQMNGRFGAMLSFELSDSKQTAVFLQKLDIIEPMVSLGGVESTICQASETSHKKMPRAERLKIGVNDELLRLSVGIEDAADLIGDLEKALGV